jgi:valyl-tRNA synthetase
MVRDKMGRKMSKSLGNSPDLLELIEKVGADAVRFGIMIASPAGNDLLFDEASLEQGRNFNNKIWNALKLVRMWSTRVGEGTDNHNDFAISWFNNRLRQVRSEVDGLMQQFRLSEALKTIYSLVWDDFCSWYLEWVKPGFEQPVDARVYDQTVAFFSELMQLLHPFMPFITEEVYHLLDERTDDLCIRQFSHIESADNVTLQKGTLLKEVITAIRDVRTKNQIKPKDEIRLHIQTSSKESYKDIQYILLKQVNAGEIIFTETAVDNTLTFVLGRDTYYIESGQPVDTEGQKLELIKEMDYLKGFIVLVDKKLGNERFISNAKPEVVELERRKKADAETKLKVIEESLANM